MGAMNHCRDGGYCIWCDEPWPCDTARIRRELARFIRDGDYRPNETDGAFEAAGRIDIEGV